LGGIFPVAFFFGGFFLVAFFLGSIFPDTHKNMIIFSIKKKTITMELLDSDLMRLFSFQL